MQDPNRGLFKNVYAQKIRMFSHCRRPNVLEHKKRLSLTVVGEGVSPSTQNSPEQQGD